jgi:hypothetical protein
MPDRIPIAGARLHIEGALRRPQRGQPHACLPRPLAELSGNVGRKHTCMLMELKHRKSQSIFLRFLMNHLAPPFFGLAGWAVVHRRRRHYGWRRPDDHRLRCLHIGWCDRTPAEEESATTEEEHNPEHHTLSYTPVRMDAFAVRPVGRSASHPGSALPRVLPPLSAGQTTPITGARCGLGRAMSRRGSQVEEGGHGHEKAAKRPTSVQAMRPALERKSVAPPRDWTRDTL